LKPQAKEKTGSQPKQHHDNRQADGCHGHQHRPALPLVEVKPLEPLGQEQEDFDGKQSKDQPIRREVIPSAFGVRLGHSSNPIETSIPFFVPPEKKKIGGRAIVQAKLYWLGFAQVVR